jgi:hypothetical protein
MATISDFSSKFRGGVRPNLFACNITVPGAVGQLSREFSFHCKGTSMPVSTVPSVDVPFLGRQLKIPGDRSYGDWTVTVFNDIDMAMRHTFEGWMAKLQNHGANIQHSNAHNDIYGQGTVTQLRRDGTAISTYALEIIPTEVAAIELDWGTNDSVEEYGVTFAVNYWVPKSGGSNFTSGGSDSTEWNINVGSSGISGSVSGALGSLGVNFPK